MRGPRSSSKVTAAYEDASGTVTQGGPLASRSSVGAGGEESAGDESGNLKGLLRGSTGGGAAGSGGKKKGAAKPGHAQDGVLIVERGKALEDEYLLGQRTSCLLPVPVTVLQGVVIKRREVMGEGGLAVATKSAFFRVCFFPAVSWPDGWEGTGNPEPECVF